MDRYSRRAQKRNQTAANPAPASRLGDFSQELLDLAAEGLVRLPQRRLDWKAFFALPAPRVPLAKLKRAIEAER